MSVKKQIELKKGVSGEFICRINSVQVTSKPTANAQVTASYAWYFDNDEKDKGITLFECSVQLPVAGFIGNKNPIEQAYIELKAEGQFLNGGTDV